MLDKFNLKEFCCYHKISFENFSRAVKNVYFPLVERLHNHLDSAQKRPYIIGINGAQGSGKTTLTDLLSKIFEIRYSMKVVKLSIDDLYYPRTARNQLAKQLHPLFATRGVPGTHDISLGFQIFNQLINAQSSTQTLLPKFSKSKDDREIRANWKTFRGKPDIIIFEGWCVGSQAQNSAALATPVNELERSQDPNLRWRKIVNELLATQYQELFSFIDFIIYLQAPDFSVACQWRNEQEQKLISKLQSQGQSLENTLSARKLHDFMMYFERITTHDFKTMPNHANIVIPLDVERSPLTR